MKRTFLAILLAFVVSLLVLAPGQVEAADVDKVVFIVNIENPNYKKTKAKDFTTGFLKDVFLKNKDKWTDGTKILPCQMPSKSDEAKIVRDSVLGMSEKDIAEHWSSKREKGVGEPVEKKKSKLVYRYVSGDKAAIGYVNKSYLDDVDDWKEKVTVVFTQNK